MSENKPEELNSQAVPFFARFLEGQSFEDFYKFRNLLIFNF
ncbi:Protease inhibitor I10, marinostatin [Nostoc flagelliforme CCNUN1]|uniref:Protease inhibitor I10, marinostatin n=1 Tax=Nostoc flagelliforme CCNUN1 TaxID=2038116 RepID=A0A2K8SNY4_9NOSO|nr:microviridin/marinostatin family tricyclic proteinase inhibitor [Nostoc flagelliforme]AUB37186.1 Protease inhibitor I10, marinostatin [Nostoc flagelliforme CCNUN1]